MLIEHRMSSPRKPESAPMDLSEAISPSDPSDQSSLSGDESSASEPRVEKNVELTHKELKKIAKMIFDMNEFDDYVYDYLKDLTKHYLESMKIARTQEVDAVNERVKDLRLTINWLSESKVQSVAKEVDNLDISLANLDKSSSQEGALIKLEHVTEETRGLPSYDKGVSPPPLLSVTIESPQGDSICVDLASFGQWARKNQFSLFAGILDALKWDGIYAPRSFLWTLRDCFRGRAYQGAFWWHPEALKLAGPVNKHAPKVKPKKTKASGRKHYNKNTIEQSRKKRSRVD